MLRWVREHALMVVSLISGVFLIFLAGLVSGHLGLPPSGTLAEAISGARHLKHATEAEIRGVPKQHLMPRRPGIERTVVHDAPAMEPGPTLITGVFGNWLGTRLYAADGTILHEWPIDFFTYSPEEMRYRFHALLHGTHVYPNGDVLVNYDQRGLVRQSACGKVVWRNHDKPHHSIHVTADGLIWAPVLGPDYELDEVIRAPFAFDRIGVFDPDTGTKVDEIALIEVVIASDLLGLILANDVVLEDMAHLNDVEVLSSELAPAFPMFKAGDILLSVRHYHQIWVVDGETHKLKWWFSGPMVGQHDPDFQPDGTITVFDNRTGGPGLEADGYLGSKGGSRILRIDPATKEYTVAFGFDPDIRFYTPYRGKHQILPNGNILMAETDAGRVLEVDPKGRLLWSFVNNYDASRVGWVLGAERLPPDFFDDGALDCPSGG